MSLGLQIIFGAFTILAAGLLTSLAVLARRSRGRITR